MDEMEDFKRRGKAYSKPRYVIITSVTSGLFSFQIFESVPEWFVRVNRHANYLCSKQ